MTTLTLGYWNIRGYGSAIRNLLRYVNVQYEDIVYEYDPLPAYKEPWFKVRSEIGLDFPNLPYLIDGDLKISQSPAIIRHLGRKFGLIGQNDAELAKEDMIYFQLLDLNYRMVQTVYYKSYNTPADFEAELELIKQDLDTQLELLEKYLQYDDNWFTGKRISYVDFFIYEIIDRYREIIRKDCLMNYPKLSAFMKKFEALEQLKAFLASDEYRKAPIFGPAAKLGNVRR